MPTYRYRCTGCGEDFEVWQSINDARLTVHDGACGGGLTRVLSPAGIVLKGSGFYKTDNRGKNGSATKRDGAKDGTKNDGANNDGAKPETKADTKPSTGSSDSGTKAAASA